MSKFSYPLKCPGVAVRATLKGKIFFSKQCVEKVFGDLVGCTTHLLFVWIEVAKISAKSVPPYYLRASCNYTNYICSPHTACGCCI